MFDIDLRLGSRDSRNTTILVVIMSMFVLRLGLAGVRSGGHTAGLKRRHSLFDCASADTTNLFEITAILVECSFEMCTASFFGVVMTKFVLVVARIFVAGLLALEGGNGDDAFF